MPLVKANKAGLSVNVNQLEAQAKVVEAQAEVPQALSQALRDGHMGVMDYYNMNNIMADTKMRETIAEGETTELTTQPNPRNK